MVGKYVQGDTVSLTIHKTRIKPESVEIGIIQERLVITQWWVFGSCSEIRGFALTYEHQIADTKWTLSKLLALGAIILVSIPHFEDFCMTASVNTFWFCCLILGINRSSLVWLGLSSSLGSMAPMRNRQAANNPDRKVTQTQNIRWIFWRKPCRPMRRAANNCWVGSRWTLQWDNVVASLIQTTKGCHAGGFCRTDCTLFLNGFRYLMFLGYKVGSRQPGCNHSIKVCNSSIFNPIHRLPAAVLGQLINDRIPTSFYFIKDDMPKHRSIWSCNDPTGLLWGRDFQFHYRKQWAVDIFADKERHTIWIWGHFWNLQPDVPPPLHSHPL